MRASMLKQSEKGKWQKTDLGFRTVDFRLFRVENCPDTKKCPEDIKDL